MALLKLTMLSIMCTAFRVEAANDSSFIDNSFFVKEFLIDGPFDSQVKIISDTGNSSKVELVKRFIEIVEDKDGKQTAPYETENYNYFCERPLVAGKDTEFVRRHLGQYPVIHVNYRSLRDVENYNSVVEKLKQIILETFKRHGYLLQNSTLFPVPENKDLFVKHCDDVAVKTLAGSDVERALGWLTQLLSKHFGKRVIVLIEQYDAYCNNLVRELNDSEDVLELLIGMNRKLLKNNIYLMKALVSVDFNVSPLRRNIEEYDENVAKCSDKLTTFLRRVFR